jgi:hypothetical protein
VFIALVQNTDIKIACKEYNKNCCRTWSRYDVGDGGRSADAKAACLAASAHGPR